ncbi:MAG: hypothetical protein KA118_08965 [Verrucomicrobia bacterium]|nr:hypothetical protein [Verrucomicrobiota bacterium]
MKQILTILAACLGFTLLGAPAPERTDLAKDVYVEKSPADFALTQKAAAASAPHVLAFELAAGDRLGQHTLLCFVDGALWQLTRIDLPGVYRLSTRGLAPGEHRITFQVVTADNRIGAVTFKISRP